MNGKGNFELQLSRDVSQAFSAGAVASAVLQVREVATGQSAACTLLYLLCHTPSEREPARHGKYTPRRRRTRRYQ